MFEKLRDRLSRRPAPSDLDKEARDHNRRADDERLDVRVATRLGPNLVYPPERDDSRHRH